MNCFRHFDLAVSMSGDRSLRAFGFYPKRSDRPADTSAGRPSISYHWCCFLSLFSC